MAGIISQENDLKNHRVFAMWEECGIQFRANIITEVGGGIKLHKHDYDHVAICTQGRFLLNNQTEIKPGSKTTILRDTEHSFKLIADAPGEIICLWPCPKE